MRYVQADHGDVGTGMEHAICGFRILNDVRFRSQIPTVAFLRQRALLKLLEMELALAF